MVIASGATPEFIGLNSSEPPFAVLPKPAQIFGKRATRFRELAVGHALAPFLTFLATLADAQGRVASFGPDPILDDAEMERAFAHEMPPMPKELAAQPGFEPLLDALIGQLAAVSLDEGPKAAFERLVALQPDARAELVTAVSQGAFPLEQLAEAAIVAAALQVWFVRAAAQLDAKRLKTVEEGVCPACGGAPVASMIVGWPEAPSARYLCCSLCNTNWNYVRVKCTACAETKAISYRHITDQPDHWAAEVCETCGGYAKHLLQQKAPTIDPFADDIASYGLDVLLRDEGWRRTTINPFFVV